MVQMGSRAWPTSKGWNVMADALAGITSIWLMKLLMEVCPKIFREYGLAVLELLVVILANCGR